MRLILALVLLVLPGLAANAQSRPTLETPQLVATYPHDVGAFTQGLFIHDGQLYESTGQVGESVLRRVDLESGAVLQEVDLPGRVFGEGSTQIGDEIFVLSWRAQTGFIYDPESFDLIDQFSYPGEGWGLTTDGTHLIMSDGSARLRILDPTEMSLQRELVVTLNGRPVARLNELEWIDGEIWANVWMTSTIVRINPESGAVTGMLNLRAFTPDSVAGSNDAVLNGIAYDRDSGRIFVTGKMWPVLYEIVLDNAE